MTVIVAETLPFLVASTKTGYSSHWQERPRPPARGHQGGRCQTVQAAGHAPGRRYRDAGAHNRGAMRPVQGARRDITLAYLRCDICGQQRGGAGGAVSSMQRTSLGRGCRRGGFASHGREHGFSCGLLFPTTWRVVLSVSTAPTHFRTLPFFSGPCRVSPLAQYQRTRASSWSCTSDRAISSRPTP